MDYYVSKKAGSIMFRQPKKQQLVAGSHIPADVWAATAQHAKDELLKTGMVEGFEDPDSVKLVEPEAENLPRIGVGKDKFMPEARVQTGNRVDAKLEALKAEQERRAQQAEDDSEVDEEAGGSRDGVVKVELPPEEQDEDAEDALTEEEFAALEAMDRAEQDS